MSSTSNCTNTALYESLEHCKGVAVLPGIRGAVYYIPKRDIVTFPSLPSSVSQGGTMSDLAKITGNFVLAADAVFERVDIVSSASSVNCESQGEAPSKTFLINAVFKYAGNNAAAAAFARQANNDDLVYLYQQRDGQFRIVGNMMFETNTTPAQESGSAETDASGTTINVSVTDVMPAPFYCGVFQTDDGWFSGVDGSPAEEPVTPAEETVTTTEG